MRRCYLLLLLCMGVGCLQVHAQMLDASQYSGGTVGDKVNAAQTQGCVTGMSCVISIPANLSVWPSGTMPTRCASCVWLDYRTAGVVSFISGSNTTNAAGVFSNTQMNEYQQTIINSASPLTEFQTAQGVSNYATEGITGAMAVPSGSTVFQAQPLAGYVSNASTTTNAVGVYGWARALAASVKVWGANFGCADGGFAATLTCTEIDANPSNASTTGAALSVSGSFSGNPTSFPAFVVGAPIQGGKWSHGVLIKDGATQTGLWLGAQGTVANSASQNLVFGYRDSGNAGQIASIGVSPLGVMNLNAATGQAVATGTFFQAPYFASSSAGAAASGQIRLASADAIGFRNAANNGDVLMGHNSSDQFTFGGALSTPGVVTTTAAPTVSASQIGIGAGTATTATAGTNGAVPSAVAGYWIINVAGTTRKVPFFAN